VTEKSAEHGDESESLELFAARRECGQHDERAKSVERESEIEGGVR